jgi:hypothetical protein
LPAIAVRTGWGNRDVVGVVVDMVVAKAGYARLGRAGLSSSIEGAPCRI